MRFIRTRQADGAAVHAVLLSDGRARALPGPPWESREAVGEAFVPGPRLAPVLPPVIIGIAQNYRAHAAEMGGELGEHPVYFMKLPTNVQDPDEPIRLPRALRSDKVDYEGELAVVLGRTCRDVSPEEAMDAVLGFCIANDVTARDWQKEWGGGQFCRGKSFDTFCPLGPELVTLDELRNPFALDLTTRLNGEVVQASSTDDLIFDIPTLIAFLSGSTTLPAGTVILTGTPSGVGMARTPPRYLRAGDVVEIEIEGLGRLRNPVVEECAGAPV
ncbi:MAG: fumarylacetoacetate hydrolase family protein [Opitutales bacterium]|nr:fumarylacetoacetate hydrolase family protein [Opitutales bacterium]